jgi:hypothetical protein
VARYLLLRAGTCRYYIWRHRGTRGLAENPNQYVKVGISAAPGLPRLDIRCLSHPPADKVTKTTFVHQQWRSPGFCRYRYLNQNKVGPGIVSKCEVGFAGVIRSLQNLVIGKSGDIQFCSINTPGCNSTPTIIHAYPPPHSLPRPNAALCRCRSVHPSE